MFVAAGRQGSVQLPVREDASGSIGCGIGESSAAVACDLNGLESAQDLVKATRQALWSLDILVANHGIWPPNDAPIDRLTDAQWRTTVAVNLDSVFSLIRASVATNEEAVPGRTRLPGIVVVSSTAGQRGEAFHADYAATKGALISMVKGLSTELAGDGIHVNCVAPGWVGTEMSEPALNDPTTRDKIFATIPLGRVGTPEQIAAPILFLCTEHAGFITGEVFNVNGGAVLAG